MTTRCDVILVCMTFFPNAGTIPPQLGELHTVEELYLDHNNLEGKVGHYDHLLFVFSYKGLRRQSQRK